MKKFLVAFIAGLVLIGTAPQPAEAFFGPHFIPKHHFKPPFKPHFKPHFKKFHWKWKHVHKPHVPKVTPAAAKPTDNYAPRAGHKVSWVPQYVFASTACSAVFLWIQALEVGRAEHRELTQKEAWTTIGNCYLPIIGGYIMGSLAQQP